MEITTYKQYDCIIKESAIITILPSIEAYWSFDSFRVNFRFLFWGVEFSFDIRKYGRHK